MRTSRISRDTSRILAATQTQRTLRQTRSVANLPTRTSGTTRQIKDEEANSDSSLSDSDAPPVKKRKRGQDAPVIIKNETTETSLTTLSSATKPKKARRTPAKKNTSPDGTVTIQPPSNWEEIYALTREMRNENLAPVDTMGCESLAEESRSPRDRRFQTLIALMLSSQTKDTVNAVAMRGMQENMPGGLNLESILAIDPTTLNAFIAKVGFHNLKTKYIKATALLLRDTFNSDIPDTIEGLVSLPGVGPKMAYLTMSAAWGKDLGIGVDVHVHRITNLWGWHKTQTPEQTRKALEAWLPREKWHDVNNLLVGFGQTVCLPVGRKCGACKLGVRGLCPSSVVARGAKGRVKKEAVVEVEVGGAEGVGKEEVVREGVRDVKVEDVGDVVGDIEDIGRTPGRRTPRRKT